MNTIKMFVDEPETAHLLESYLWIFYVLLYIVLGVFLCITVLWLLRLFSHAAGLTKKRSGPAVPLRSRLLVITAINYALVSVYAGPYIVFRLGDSVIGENGLVPAGALFDPSDDSWGNTTQEEYQMVVQTVRGMVRFAAGAMFALGLTLLLMLVVSRRKAGNGHTNPVELTVIFMLCGYGVTLVLLDWLYPLFD